MGTIKQESAGDRNLTQSSPSAEVPAVGRKRRHSEAYKLRILEEADACKRGELGAVLRREGLYHSTIIKWRTWRDTMLDLQKKAFQILDLMPPIDKNEGRS